MLLHGPARFISSGLLEVQTKSKLMNTVADTRKEKNEADLREEYQRNKRNNPIHCRIEHLNLLISQEKDGAKDCLDQGFYTMAKSKISRIESIRKKIIKLNSTI